MSGKITFNSAIPQWSLEQSCRGLRATRSNIFGNKSSEQSSDLAALLTNHDKEGWPVRNQQARGTCNAFAVVAAEELFRFIKSGQRRYEPLSEEYLYSKARDKPFARVPDPPEGKDLEQFQNLGGTYLSQVMAALVENGLADADDATYAPTAAVNYQVGTFPTEVEARSAGRKVDMTSLRHDITKAVIEENKDWIFDTARSALVEFFADRLARQIPVVAAFAVLNDAEYVWHGHYARASGHIRYPAFDVAKRLSPVAGHSVCLVGYRPNPEGGADNPGTFLFRNSYGTELFGRHADQYPGRLNTGRPGYGIISARDVSLYCWEYLTRASDEDVALLTGAACTDH